MVQPVPVSILWYVHINQVLGDKDKPEVGLTEVAIVSESD